MNSFFIGNDFFISGNTAEKKKRILERYDIEKNKAEDFIRKTDKRRASYYNYYTDMKWGEAKNYDLCINSSKTGVDGAIKLMKAYIEIKEANADKQEFFVLIHFTFLTTKEG